MKNNIKYLRISTVSIAMLILTLVLSTTLPTSAKADSLFVGDQTDPSASGNTVKRFDAATGTFLGAFVTTNSGGLHGPRGLIFSNSGDGENGDLLVVNQNQGLPLNGEVLRYDGQTGVFLKALIPATNPNAPFAPRGMVLWDDQVLFVADFEGGRLLAFQKNGKFLANLTPGAQPFAFHPRGVVIGPDGLLYVSNFPDLTTGLGGQVLRFNPETGAFKDVFITDAGGVDRLNRPEGLVFGPDGKLYITSFRDNSQPSAAGNTDQIRIYNGTTGSFIDKIDLDVVGQPRAFAQALLFGPQGRLFVPINGNGPDTGAVRRYKVDTKAFDNFVKPSVGGGALGAPFYLTFGKTNPATLAYGENN
jgi:hypothetical protein